MRCSGLSSQSGLKVKRTCRATSCGKTAVARIASTSLVCALAMSKRMSCGSGGLIARRSLKLTAAARKFFPSTLSVPAAARVVMATSLKCNASADDDVLVDVVVTSVPLVAVMGVTGSVTTNAKSDRGGVFWISRNVASGSASDFAACKARSRSAVWK